MDKAGIEKILDKYADMQYLVSEENAKDTFTRTQATSSLTSLIIKWLESKKKELLIMPTYQCNGKITQEVINKEELGRNQLITELIGELR